MLEVSVLLETWQMDATLLIFVSMAFIKYVIFKDKESTGIKLIVLSGLLLLIDSTFQTLPWTVYGINNIYQTLSIILDAGASILAIIGSIKLALELFK